jgi:hypothetical protein
MKSILGAGGVAFAFFVGFAFGASASDVDAGGVASASGGGADLVAGVASGGGAGLVAGFVGFVFGASASGGVASASGGGVDLVAASASGGGAGLVVLGGEKTTQ